jgi:hypothetical protein
MTNAEKRKQKNALRTEILELILETLMDLIKSDDLSDNGKMNAVTMLDEIRHELGLDHSF